MVTLYKGCAFRLRAELDKQELKFTSAIVFGYVDGHEIVATSGVWICTSLKQQPRDLKHAAPLRVLLLMKLCAI